MAAVGKVGSFLAEDSVVDAVGILGLEVDVLRRPVTDKQSLSADSLLFRECRWDFINLRCLLR